MYDEKRRILQIEASEIKRERFRQQGLYEKLLCTDCETIFSTFEKHVDHVFFKEFYHQETNRPGEIMIVNLDYAKFKLFQLSVIWRASVAKHPFFSNVALGPHEERIRLMLLAGNPGKFYEYGCMIFGLKADPGQGFDLIISPDHGKIEGHMAYRFIFGGCLWVYIVSSHSLSFSRSNYFLQESGTLMMPFFKAKEVPFIRTLVQQIFHTK